MNGLDQALVAVFWACMAVILLTIIIKKIAKEIKEDDD